MKKLALMAVLLCGPAIAEQRTQHDPNDPDHWYDAACCSLNDCEPVAYGVVTLGADGVTVRIEPGQHKLWPEGSGRVIEARLDYDDTRIRRSQDGQDHVCMYTGGDWGGVYSDEDMILCVYIGAIG